MSNTKSIDITDPNLPDSYDVKVVVPLSEALSIYQLTIEEDYDNETVIYHVARGLIALLVEAALLTEIE